jgi:hypothetical protein
MKSPIRKRSLFVEGTRLVRTYVILVLPKCLLPWEYVKVDVAAFCLQHLDRHGGGAGPGEI